MRVKLVNTVVWFVSPVPSVVSDAQLVNRYLRYVWEGGMEGGREGAFVRE